MQSLMGPTRTTEGGGGEAQATAAPADAARLPAPPLQQPVPPSLPKPIQHAQMSEKLHAGISRGTAAADQDRSSVSENDDDDMPSSFSNFSGGGVFPLDLTGHLPVAVV